MAVPQNNNCKRHIQKGIAMRLLLNTCGIVVILYSLVWFATHNAQTVPVQVSPSLHVEFPLWSLILAPFMVGVVMGNALDVIQKFKLRRELKRLRRSAANAISPTSRT